MRYKKEPGSCRGRQAGRRSGGMCRHQRHAGSADAGHQKSHRGELRCPLSEEYPMEKFLRQLPDRLLPWFAENRRDLPWRRDREPYHIWVSEIMLQQTRVEAVRGYYARFLEALPTVADLAKAPDDGLGKLWEGLGYYSRMRNLRAAAQVVQEKWNGQIPRDYDAVRSLPGIGDYTAGAICSIAFDMPTPAVDGNVLRVLARVLADSRPVDLPSGGKPGEALAAVYPEGRCGDFTQALMELGATVCIPNGAPQCGRCPLADLCQARATGQWRELPCRLPKRKRRQEDWTVFILDCGGRFALEQRGPSGLLAGLWQFPNVPGTLGEPSGLRSGSPMGNGAHRLSAQRRPDPHLHPHPVEPPLLPHRLPASNPGLPVDDGRRNPGPGTPAHGLPSIPGLFYEKRTIPVEMQPLPFHRYSDVRNAGSVRPGRTCPCLRHTGGRQNPPAGLPNGCQGRCRCPGHRRPHHTHSHKHHKRIFPW